MLKSSLFSYSDTCILIKGTIKITGAKDKAGARQADERNTGAKLQNLPLVKDVL